MDPDRTRGQELSGLTGKVLWATHLLWSEILRSWCEAQNRRTLGVIPFDKMCLLTGLVWNHLKDQKIVQWGVPYMPAPGEHGHGPKLFTAAEKRRRPFVVDFLKTECLIFPQFARNVFGLIPPPESEESQVKKVESTLWKETIEGYVGEEGVLTEQERQVVGELGKIVGLLTAEEIRVLGVHGGVDRTIEAIEFNASFWYRVATALIDKLAKHRSPQGKMLDKVTQLAKELLRKAGLRRDGAGSGARRGHPGNEQIYVRARGRVKDAKKVDSHVLQAVLHVCPEPAEIWGKRGAVVPWQPIVRELAMFTSYLDGLDAKATAASHPKRRVSDRERRRLQVGEEARAEWVALGYTLPQYEEVFGARKSTQAGYISDALRKFLGRFPEVRYPEHWVRLLPTTRSA